MSDYSLGEIGFVLITGGLGAPFVEQRHEARNAAEDRRRAANEQRKARNVQEARSAEAAMNERRKQYREERIRRAQIIAASENTGVSGGSGELGSLAGLSTKAGAAIGSNIGGIAAGQAISQYEQTAADFLGSAQDHMNDANTWGQIGSLVIQGATIGVKRSG